MQRNSRQSCVTIGDEVASYDVKLSFFFQKGLLSFRSSALVYPISNFAECQHHLPEERQGRLR
jgi:hypothetical protein